MTATAVLPPRPRARLRGLLTLALYQAVFVSSLVLFGPVLLWRMVFDPRYRRGLRTRLGYLEPWTDRGDGPVVWIHGVSVGEIKAAGTLIEELRVHYPNASLALSATTPTGHGVARDLGPDRVFFYPLDFGRAPGRALDRIKPDCVVLMEKELWPNFLQAAARRRIPVAVVNGRISEKSFAGYRRVRWLLPQLDLVSCWCVQDEAYAQRLRDLDLDEGRIHVTGNMKYDSVAVREASPRSVAIQEWLSPDGRPVVVAGSTHGQEEVWVADAVREAARRSGRLMRIVLAPRHPERSSAVAESLEAQGWKVRRWSRDPAPRGVLGDDELVLVDTIGHLESFYGASSLAFVGGSLVPHGGQNMLEPASMGRAVVFGPHVANFQRDVEILLGAGAARQVGDRTELADALCELLGDDEARRRLGEAAVDVILRNKGATKRTLTHLRPLLESKAAVGERSEEAIGVRSNPAAAIRPVQPGS